MLKKDGKMKWRWCVMCVFDGHCQNQDANKECNSYAREQTLRAEQYSNLIDRIGNQNLLLKVANAELREQLEILRGKMIETIFGINYDKIIDLVHKGLDMGYSDPNKYVDFLLNSNNPINPERYKACVWTLEFVANADNIGEAKLMALKCLQEIKK